MWNFIHEDASIDDITSLFGDMEGKLELVNEEWGTINDETKLEDIVIRMGVFKSKSQARKNNWSGEIPMGFREWKIGKKHFWTYKPMENIL